MLEHAGLQEIAVEERFGSWTTQYAYADFLTQRALLDRGTWVDGGVAAAGKAM